jgi:hypothetical protein
MHRILHASLSCSLPLIALFAVASAPTDRGRVADAPTNSDQAAGGRSTPAPTVLAGPCYVINGRWVCP